MAHEKLGSKVREMESGCQRSFVKCFLKVTQACVAVLQLPCCLGMQGEVSKNVCKPFLTT